MAASQRVLVGVGLAKRVLVDVSFAKSTGIGLPKGYW